MSQTSRNRTLLEALGVASSHSWLLLRSLPGKERRKKVEDGVGVFTIEYPQGTALAPSVGVENIDEDLGVGF